MCNLACLAELGSPSDSLYRNPFLTKVFYMNRSSNIIHCGRRSHSDIPKFIPMDATAIYLDGSRLGSLTGDEFIGRKHLVSRTVSASVQLKFRRLSEAGTGSNILGN